MKGGNNIFSLPVYLAVVLVFPVLGVLAGAVAFPHPPALVLGCMCLFGFLYLFSGSKTSEAMIPLIAVVALATSLWWFIVGRKKVN